MQKIQQIRSILFISSLSLGGISACQCSTEFHPVEKASHNGGFKLIFGDPESAEHRSDLQLVKPEVERVINMLNNRVSLPVDVPIIFSSKTTQQSPAFSPGTSSGISAEGLNGRIVVFPYQWIAFTKVVLSGLSQPESDAAVIGSTAFILMHEASHALIDVLQLPVLGREEDAADSGRRHRR